MNTQKPMTSALTTRQVRETFQRRGRLDEIDNGNEKAWQAEARRVEEFDRWLDQHDADLCAKVLETVLSNIAEYPNARSALPGYRDYLRACIRDLLAEGSPS